MDAATSTRPIPDIEADIELAELESDLPLFRRVLVRTAVTGYEAVCEKCEETFNPAASDDLIHGETTSTGESCEGKGVIVGWYGGEQRQQLRYAGPTEMILVEPCLTAAEVADIAWALAGASRRGRRAPAGTEAHDRYERQVALLAKLRTAVTDG